MGKLLYNTIRDPRMLSSKILLLHSTINVRNLTRQDWNMWGDYITNKHIFHKDYYVSSFLR